MAEYIVSMEPEHPEFQVLVGALLRCRDCRFYTDEPGLSGVKPKGKYCDKYSSWDSEWDYDSYHYVEPDGYCAWGEPAPAGSGEPKPEIKACEAARDNASDKRRES